MWYSDALGEDQLTTENLNNQGVTGKVTAENKPSLFDGGLTAIGQGVKAAGGKLLMPLFGDSEDNLKVAQGDKFQKDLFEYQKTQGQIPQDLTFEDHIKGGHSSAIKDTLTFIEDTKPGADSGTGAHVIYGLTDYVTRGIAGGVAGGIGGAAYVTGQSEYSYVKENLMSQGVDPSTATKVAGTDAVIAGGAVYLPLSWGLKGKGGIYKDALLSIGLNTGIMNVGRAISGGVLESEGYEKQAEYYDINSTTLTTDVVLSSLMFGAGRYMRSRQENNTSEELNADAIQARNEAVEDVLTQNDLEVQDLAPSNLTDPVQMNQHQQNTNIATQQILSGRPVDVPNSVPVDPPKPKVMDYENSAIPTHAKTIARQAKQAGIDPSVALTISHIETGGTFSHTAQNPSSSAHGLFQVIDKTWRGLGGRSRADVNEQIRIGLKHIQLANREIQKAIGRPVVAHEQYLGHLLGPAGATHVLKADPNARLIDIVRKYDKENAEAIVNNNGMRNLTVGEAINKWKKKWDGLSRRYQSESTSTAYGMDGSSYQVQYDVVPLNDLVASNDAAYGVNPLYPVELQPRDRTRVASRQQVEEMANNLRPELLGESYKLSDGAPIIDFNNIVESGNGRTLAIGKAYEGGKGIEYEAMVRDMADRMGIPFEGIVNPVLVRRRITDTDAVKFSRLANESDVAQMSVTERATSDADRLPDPTLLNVRSDGSINIDGSTDYVRQFVSALPKSEQANAMTPDGKLSQEGKRRIESALMQKAYGDNNLVARMSENLDDDSKNIINALLKNAPRLAQLNDLAAQGGRHANTIAHDVAQAAQKFSDLKANDLKVDDYLKQGQLIDDGLSPGAKELLKVFDENGRSAKAIGEYLQKQIDDVDQMGDPRQGSLFGDDAEGLAVSEIVNSNPNQMIAVRRTLEDGTEVETEIPLKQYVEELDAEVKQADIDNLAAQTAITCALKFGE